MSTLLAHRSLRGGVLLSGRTSFKIGGEAPEFYAPETAADLEDLAGLLRREGRDPYVLGGGCNTLFPDGAFARPVISTEGFSSLEISGSRIRAGAGVRLEALIREAIRHELGGLECFLGIPGTAGGAAAMNAGGSGHSFGERVVRVAAVRLETGERETIPSNRIAWDYRTAHLDGLVVTEVELDLVPADGADIRRRARAFLRKKAAEQPLSSVSAGCVFRNPRSGPAAAALIDRAGLKGAREGGAVVSPRHANFILNDERRASARDVLVLIERVRARVEEVFGVRLETELVIPQLRGAGEPVW